MDTTLKSTTLRPGLLVSFKTSMRGNVSYEKQIIESAHLNYQDEEIERWETLRRVTKPDELEAGKKARGKASSLIRGVCAKSAFGLLCPEDRAGRLAEAIAEAHAVVDVFNASADMTMVSINVLTGRIVPDDAEAVRAINSEVRDLLEAMRDGVKTLNPTAIREAATRARGLGAMLEPQAQERMQEAIKAARGVARDIVKAGETAAIEVDDMAVKAITEARYAFLDLDDAQTIEAPEAQGRGIDLTVDDVYEERAEAYEAYQETLMKEPGPKVGSRDITDEVKAVMGARAPLDIE